ncbi:hypothetical protein ACLSU7_09160 [Bdellovibrio sp. HCB185ZH]|uniref:hypothetical protein n=1 Tax=Bdellovibrio sp. HCB185ZH TaxID=3394235 RepID=UPI0039A4888D
MIAPVGCSFKNDHQKPVDEKVLFPAGKAPTDSKNRPSVFEAVAKKDDAIAISVIDQYSASEIDALEQNGESVLDAVLKTGSTTLLRYLIGRGASPVKFGFQSLEWSEGSYGVTADLIPYLYERFEKISTGDATFDNLHFSEAACAYFIQLEFRKMSITKQMGKDSSEEFLEAAKLFTNSKNCRDSLKKVPSDYLSIWFRDEFYRQSNFGFSNIGVLRFLDLVSVDRQIEFSIQEPYLGGNYERDPRLLLFFSSLKGSDWVTFMNIWWPLLSRHSKLDTAANENSKMEEPGSDRVPLVKEREYQGYFISETALEICKNSELEIVCNEFKGTFKLGDSNE